MFIRLLTQVSVTVAVAASTIVFGFAPPAAAHVERPSYWPQPAPDCSVQPCAGGAVPQVRSLDSALTPPAGSTTRVVCRPDSLELVKASVARARQAGYYIRPTDHRELGEDEAQRLLQINTRLFERCRYAEIQPAVTASGNNDRVVVMPGLYTEPTARKAPTHDPACDKYEDISGAYSYEGEFRCPNDTNLIAVMGREPGSGKDPEPPLTDRHGIPNLGDCIRCNLQLEGSGVSADDVIVEAGDPSSGNGGPRRSAKDVGIRADRADGFVLRNLTVRHANEHNIYVLESDGYQLDRFKAFYGGEYGVLTFVEDHGLIQNCEAAGNGDSGVYPGAGAKTAAGRDTRYYPEARYSQEIRYCDSHHNTGGYSGTNGAAVHLHHNNFFDNALGFTTDVFTAAGHPGFPQQGALVENNDFYSNNFNPYLVGSDVTPTVPLAVGTGLWIAGGNDNVVRTNRFYDNWRRGVMLFSVPDAAVCGPLGGDDPVPGCDPLKISTSHRNQFHHNAMGVAPGGKARPNGVDFWWDSFPGNSGNCWWANTAVPGKAVTGSPLLLPDCLGGRWPLLSLGTGDVVNELELLSCLVDAKPGGSCPWFTTPNPPGGSPGGGGSPGTPATHTPEPGSTFGSMALADCTYWKGADTAERTKLLDAMRTLFGRRIDQQPAHGPTLTNEQATRLFDNTCGQSFAGAFKLYKLYTRAAAFTPQISTGSP